jgi:hypothetical protein
MVAGNIMDNATGHERKVMVVLDFCMSLALFSWAATLKIIKPKLKEK